MKAMIFAAGLGTRLKEETQTKPKALVEVGGKPLLQHAIEKLITEGVSEIVVNVHHFSGMVIQWIKSNHFGIPVLISDETNLLLDTGGGLKKAATMLSGIESILVYNVDIISDINLKSLANEHLKSGALATLAIRKRISQRFLKFDSQYRLTGWVNKKTGETKIAVPGLFEYSNEYAYSGIHIVNPEIFGLMPVEERFSIIDLYLQLAKNHLIKGYVDDSDLWIDVGKPGELEFARKRLAPF
jgi:NDP-sugar pyrophosphorylase family protein